MLLKMIYFLYLLLNTVLAFLLALTVYRYITSGEFQHIFDDTLIVLLFLWGIYLTVHRHQFLGFLLASAPLVFIGIVNFAWLFSYY